MTISAEGPGTALHAMLRVHSESHTVGAESIDVLGHVNNREYLRWMEAAAVRHSALNGWPMERYVALGRAWVAATHRIDYLRPAFAGDTLAVHTWIARMGASDCERRYAVLRDRKLCAVGSTVWVFVTLADGRAAPLDAVVAGSFVTVPGDDPELRALGLPGRWRWTLA